MQKLFTLLILINYIISLEFIMNQHLQRVFQFLTSIYIQIETLFIIYILSFFLVINNSLLHCLIV